MKSLFYGCCQSLMVVILFFSIENCLYSQNLSFLVTDPDCDSDGKIEINYTGSNTVQFFILEGPVCDSGACPFSDNPDGIFQSLRAGTYSIGVFNEFGNLIESQEVILNGNYIEPEAFAQSRSSICGLNSEINIDRVEGGNAPYQYRVFPGTVEDYCTVIGPTVDILNFVNTPIFQGLNPSANLVSEITCNSSETANPLPGIYTFQVRDACNVIRSKSIFLDEGITFSDPTFSIMCSEEDDCTNAISDIRISSSLFSNTSFSINKIITDPVYSDLTELLPITIVQLTGVDAPRVLDILDFNNPIGNSYEVIHSCNDEIQIGLEYNCGEVRTLVESRVVRKDCFPPAEIASYIVGCTEDRDSVKYRLSDNSVNGLFSSILCKDELNLVIRDRNNGTILYNGDLSNRDDLTWVLSAEHEVIFEYFNKCGQTTDTWIPNVPEPNRSFVWTSDVIVLCDNRFYVDIDVNNGFPEGISDVVLTSAPSGYASSLPESLGELGFATGPAGEYCFDIVSECKTESVCVNTPDDAAFNLDYTSTQACLSQLFEWELEIMDSTATADISIFVYDGNGEVIDFSNLTTESSTSSFAIDAQFCGQDIEFVVSTFGETCFSFVENIPCYEFPEGASFIPFECPNVDCDAEAINVAVSAPLKGGEAPFTYWLFNEGESIECCQPLDEIVNQNPQVTFTDLCPEVFPLDIYVTDNCGQQVFYQISFGQADFGSIIEEQIDVCEIDNIDLIDLVPDMINTGVFRPLNNGPLLNGSVFQANRSQIGECFSYEFFLGNNTLMGQCIDLVDTVDVCVISCNPLFDAEIKGEVFEDLNFDNINSFADLPVDGILVSLYDTDNNLIDQQLTNTQGAYNFMGLGVGNYYVVFELPDDFEVVPPGFGSEIEDSDVDNSFVTGSTSTIFLEESEIEAHWDAGIRCVPIPQFTMISSSDTFGCSDDPMFSIPILEYICQAFGSNTDGHHIPPSSICGAATVNFEDFIDSANCAGLTITRIWTASDLCGNIATVQQTLSAVDNEAPIISNIIRSKEYECDETPVFDIPLVNDNCSEAMLSFNDDIIGQTCGGDNITRIWTATDNCGNISTIKQTLYSIDTKSPVLLTTLTNKSFDCDAVPEFDTPDFSDNCNNVDITFEDALSTSTCGQEVITRIWFAEDQCGNVATAQQVLTAIDSDGPVITILGNNSTYHCGEAPDFNQIEVVDNCSSIDLVFEDQIGDPNCAGNSITRVWVATDACGNVTTASQTLIAIDTIAPLVVNSTPEIFVDCNGSADFEMPIIADNCSNTTVRFIDEQTNINCSANDVVRTWIFEDECGNQTLVNQVIMFIDNTSPLIQQLDPIKKYSCGDKPKFDIPNAVDQCSQVFLDFVDLIVNTTCAGDDIERTWIATDVCGNTSTTIQTLEAEDNSAPDFFNTVHFVQVNCGLSMDGYAPTAIDECSAVTLEFLDSGGMESCAGDFIYRTWVATDACGNSSSFVQSIETIDQIAPIILGVEEDGVYDCNQTPIFSNPTVYDECSEVTLIFIDVNNDEGCLGSSITRQWIAEDACGNIAIEKQTLTQEDNNAPEIMGIENDRFYSCDEIPDFSSEIYVSTAYFDFEACTAVALQQSSADYSEFTANIQNDINGPKIQIKNNSLYRVLPFINRHSCTPGVEGGIAMCVDYLQGCNYEPGNQKAVVVDIILDPQEDFVNRFHGLQFYQKSPFEFNFINGMSGPSNNPIYYSLRVLRDGFEIYREIDIITSEYWSLERFNFSNNINFEFDRRTEFKIELMAYCLNDNDAMKGVWDLDELQIIAVAEDTKVIAIDDCSQVDLSYMDTFEFDNCANPNITRTWTAVDQCGNVSTARQTLFPENDNDEPVFGNIPEDNEYPCGESPSFNDPYAFDNCSDVSIEYSDQDNGNSVTRTWVATDACGNSSSVSQTSTADCGSRNGDIYVYPNPTQGKITLDFTDIPINIYERNSEIVIYDNIGNIVDKILLKSEFKTDLLLDHLNDGVYYVKIKNGKLIKTKQILILR